MKILFLTRRFWPNVGGVEKHVLEVSKRLVKMGNEVTVVSEEIEDDGGFSRPPLAETPTDVGGKKWSLIRIPVGRNEKLKKFWIWGWLWKHRDLIKNADIIHAHDVGFWWFPFKLLYPKKPFFITFHGYEQYPVPLKNKIIRKISEKIARGNICVGDFMKKWYGTKATYVMYGAANSSTVRGVHTHTSEVSLGGCVSIVFIGRLEEQTGIMTYLKALRLLKEERINFQLTICGDGPLRKEAENYVQKRSLKVNFLGFIKNPEEYIGKSRFVFVSRYLGILETLQQKKLVFAVFDNPLKEDYLRLGELGKLVVICGNENELAEKIKFYLKNPEKEKEMTEVAYNWVKGETWEKVTRTYLELWKQRILDKPE